MSEGDGFKCGSVGNDAQVTSEQILVCLNRQVTQVKDKACRDLADDGVITMDFGCTRGHYDHLGNRCRGAHRRCS
jgi:hypothetical protein